MVTKTITSAAIGINSFKIDVEVDVVNSLPSISIVGLPDSSINEARERVRSAIKNSEFSFPTGKVIVNLAPADIKKEGTHFDLPIAIGILKEQGIEIPNNQNIAFLGELSLDGTLRKIESADEDSFSNGLLEYPHYTKPREYRGLKVPEVLLNGNHREINEFRYQKSLERTKLRRPDLLQKFNISG